MNENAKEMRRLGSTAAWLRVCLCAVSAVILLTGCSARDFIHANTKETSCFEDELLEKVTGVNDAATVKEIKPDHVVSLQFAMTAYDDLSIVLREKEYITEVLDCLKDARFVRLNGPDTDWEKADDVLDKVHPIVQNGIVLSYSVDFRDATGSFYVLPDGQACWFTSDGEAVLMTEPGAVDYMKLLGWFAAYQFGMETLLP